MSWLVKMGILANEEPKKEEPKAGAKPAETAPIVQQSVVTALPGSANDELMSTLMDVVKSKVPDNAYLKLKASMDSMMANKVDMRSAALGSAAILGVNADALTGAIAEVITVLVTEQQSFATNDYANMKANADALVAKAAELEAEINQLLENVKLLSEERVATQEAASKAHGEADVMRASFDATVTHLSNVLASEQQKLVAFLS